MKKIAIALVAIVALMVIGCQPPEGFGGVTTEQFEELKTQVLEMQTEIDNLHTALEEFTEVYNEHVEKYHKGGTPAPKPPAPPAPIQK